MGAVFRSKDLASAYKKIIENAIKDLSPDTKDSVIKVFETWEGKNSKEKLKDIMGPDESERLLKRINLNRQVDLTDEDRKVLNNILKDSLTFD